jgi:hypothetical protein
MLVVDVAAATLEAWDALSSLYHGESLTELAASLRPCRRRGRPVVFSRTHADLPAKYIEADG